MHANGDESAVRFTPCTKCGSLNFVRTYTTEQNTGKRSEVRKCEVCDHVTTIELPKE
jgi:hypothetical protein